MYNANLFKFTPTPSTTPSPKIKIVAKAQKTPDNVSMSAYAGKIVDPLDGKGKITSTHLQPRGGKAKGIAIGRNNGIDVAVPDGTPIKSIFDGKVVDVNFHKSGYGHLITVQRSDGEQAVYAHMNSKSPLKVGATVKAGDVIGAVGSSGKATGPHLSLQMGKGQFNSKRKTYITAAQAKDAKKATDPLTILTSRK